MKFLPISLLFVFVLYAFNFVSVQQNTTKSSPLHVNKNLVNLPQLQNSALMFHFSNYQHWQIQLIIQNKFIIVIVPHRNAVMTPPLLLLLILKVNVNQILLRMVLYRFLKKSLFPIPQ
ncbi:hypothetical protein C2G38_2056266 [Gigaspora rosea]|uniref:Uncharacterized protein n=1 Tax=Gigaspora rosea TaxID=44941 RepID=A0A397WAK3_9GLOM|nr:hypothetical protein C2G38_2056266 [Gigaspora rosea]